MKKAFSLLFFFITLTFLNCKDKNSDNNFKLPDKAEYNEIIKAIIEQDTAVFDEEFLKSEFIGSDLTKLKVESIIFELHIYKVTDSSHYNVDSLCFVFQDDITSQMQLDEDVFDFVNLATEEIIAKNRGQQYFGYFQFSVPILNSNHTKTLVKADFKCNGECGQGMLYTLDKINNKWIMKLAKTSWVG